LDANEKLAVGFMRKDGKTWDDIGDWLGISGDTIRQRYNRAKWKQAKIAADLTPLPSAIGEAVHEEWKKITDVR